MYTTKNFKTKKELKLAVTAYNEYLALREAGVDAVKVAPVRLMSPGLGTPKEDGTEFVEGPHYPAPHTWYGTSSTASPVRTRHEHRRTTSH
jgi:hypothetical protein